MKKQFEEDLLSFKTNMVWRQLCARYSDEEVKYLSYEEIREWISSGNGSTLHSAYREAQWKIGLEGRTLLQTFRHDFQENANLVVEVYGGVRKRVAQYPWGMKSWRENEKKKETSIIILDDKSSPKTSQQDNPTQSYNPNPLPSSAHNDRYPSHQHSLALPLPLWRRAIKLGAQVLFYILCLMGVVAGTYLLMVFIWIIFNVWI